MTLIQPKTIVISGLPDGEMQVSTNVNDYYLSDMEINGVRKRKRLTHLSPEERLLRRKLKNRVAAQTARDRKKARMEELEEAMIHLESENNKLRVENLQLQKKTDYLLQENNKMKMRLNNNDRVTIKKEHEDISGVVVQGDEYESLSESAELTSQQQMTKTHTLLNLTTHCLAFLMTLSVTNSLGYSSRSQKSLLPHLQHKLKRLQQPKVLKMLSPKLKKHLQEKWWGPQQKSWTPSKN